MRRLVLVLVASLALVPTIAPAHTATGTSGFYRIRWVDADGAIPWRFTMGFPFDTWDDRVWDGERAWNNVQRARFHTAYCNDQSSCADYTNYDYSMCPATYQKNGVHWADIPDPGRVYFCSVDSNGDHRLDQLWSVNMVIDSAFPSGTTWYRGTGAPAASQVDLWSVVAAEWGHVVGSNFNGDGGGHFLESDPICPTYDTSSYRRQTMCPHVYKGRIEARTPEAHDIHTFDAAY